MKKLKEIALYLGIAVIAVLLISVLWVVIIPALTFVGAITVIIVIVRIMQKI